MPSKLLAQHLLAEQPLDLTPHQLRRRLDSAGVLYFKNAIPGDLVLAARKEAFRIAKKHRFLSDASRIDRALMRPGLSKEHFTTNHHWFLVEWTNSKAFKKLARAPNVLRILSQIFDARPIPHPGEQAQWGRLNFPEKFVKGIVAHQDTRYIANPPRFLTVWIPAGDCPMELGGLAIAEGSNKLGRLKHHESLGLDRHLTRFEWSSANYEAGDFIVFKPLTVHKPLPNITRATARFSLDIRYCAQPK